MTKKEIISKIKKANKMTKEEILSGVKVIDNIRIKNGRVLKPYTRTSQILKDYPFYSVVEKLDNGLGWILYSSSYYVTPFHSAIASGVIKIPLINL